jgi:hypothetical protein
MKKIYELYTHVSREKVEEMIESLAKERLTRKKESSHNDKLHVWANKHSFHITNTSPGIYAAPIISPRVVTYGIVEKAPNGSVVTFWFRKDMVRQPKNGATWLKMNSKEFGMYLLILCVASAYVSFVSGYGFITFVMFVLLSGFIILLMIPGIYSSRNAYNEECTAILQLFEEKFHTSVQKKEVKDLSELAKKTMSK